MYLDWNYLGVKFDTKYLDYFIEMIEYAVLQAEFVSKGFLPNLRAICLYKIFKNIHIKSELRMNFPKNCYFWFKHILFQNKNIIYIVISKT